MSNKWVCKRADGRRVIIRQSQAKRNYLTHVLTLALWAYVIASFLARPNWGEVLSGTLVPRLSFDGPYLSTLVALMGATISPYLLFWQASQQVQEEKSSGRRSVRQRRRATTSALKLAALGVDVGMVFSNAVMYFIILATAATLFQAGQTDIQTADEAAKALRPLAGDLASVLFAIGLAGAGLLAVPVLAASAAYAICETFGWRHGLDEKPLQAKRFYGVFAASMLIGMLVNYAGVNPIHGLFLVSVLNGLLAPPLVVLVMLMANNRSIMGERVNSPAVHILGWTAALLMFAAATGLVATWVLD